MVFFRSDPSRHVNYSELEPAPAPIHHEWKPEPGVSDEELRKKDVLDGSSKPFDLKDIDIDLEINIQLNSESHKNSKKKY